MLNPNTETYESVLVRKMESLEDRRWRLLNDIEKRTAHGRPKDSIALAFEAQVRKINMELDRIEERLGLR